MKSKRTRHYSLPKHFKAETIYKIVRNINLHEQVGNFIIFSVEGADELNLPVGGKEPGQVGSKSFTLNHHTTSTARRIATRISIENSELPQLTEKYNFHTSPAGNYAALHSSA